MARAAIKKESYNEECERLIAALKFAAAAIEKTDANGLAQFVQITNNTLISQNDTFSIGVKLETNLDLCVHGEKLLAALNQCGPNFQMVQISAQELSVKSGNFRAIVPVLPSDIFGQINPDISCGALNQFFFDAIEICGKLCSGKGDRAIDQTILLKDQTIVGTNGGVAVEYWHGCGFPSSISLPKKTIDAISKLKRPFLNFGVSATSLTLYFDNNTFLKTRIGALEWPSTDHMFYNNMPEVEGISLWRGFADALRAIDKFIDNDVLVFCADTMATHADLSHAGATYAVPGLPPGYKFSAAYWRILLPHIETVFVAPLGKAWAFTGKNLRGLIIGRY